jgi:REP element-mobilizing transposase RayT
MSQPSQGFKSLNNPPFNSEQALAMVVMRKKKILASTGALSPAGFEQLTDTILRHWPKAVRQLRNRYAVVPLDGEYRFLSARYAAAHKLLLGLVFPLTTPLTRIRQVSQALLQVVEALAEKPKGDIAGLEHSLQLIRHATPEPGSSPAAPSAHEGWQVEIESSPRHEETSVPKKAALPPELNNSPDAFSNPLASSPDDSPRPSWHPLEPSQPDGDDLASIFQEELASRHADDDGDDLPWSAQLNEQDPANAHQSFPALHESDLIALAETVFDTTFYLVPRVNEHYLLGELPPQLRQWMPHLCEKYGWSLNMLSVRPDYLKWTLADFPEGLTLKMLTVVRQWTTAQIFNTFPTLAAETPAQDFWSPGYLVDTQNRDFPTQVLIAHFARDRAPQDM